MSLPCLFNLSHALLALVTLTLTAGVATAADTQANTQAGRQKAQACVVCHGPLGLSSTPDAPHLAGQPALYLSSQLLAYRSGARKHEVMTWIAKPLTDDDITKLAAWYSSIRVEARAPD